MSVGRNLVVLNSLVYNRSCQTSTLLYSRVNPPSMGVFSLIKYLHYHTHCHILTS